MTVALSAADARHLALHAQGLLGAPPRTPAAPRARVAAMLRRLRAVQLDTISVLARSHELVAYSRLGGVGRSAVEAAYWGAGAGTFEFWAHAACVIPLDDWPWYAWRRRRGRNWDITSGDDGPAAAEVVAMLRDRGPLTAADLGGAKRDGGAWWDWSPLKIAVERLLDRGVVVCTTRRGWRRVYDLAERAVPAHLLAQDPDDHACRVELLRRAARAMGVGTLDDLCDYHRLRPTHSRAAIAEAGLVPVDVEGWDRPAWADPAALDALGAGEVRGRHRTVLLSPFDSLVWHRPRTERLFGFTHRLEAYVPAPRRVHGYFAMPLLTGGRLAGRVDPKRAGRTLVARRVTVESRAVVPVGVALVEAARWTGCDSVAVEAVEPPALTGRVRESVRRAGG